MLDSLTDNPLVLPGAGILLVGLLGFGAWRLRGRLKKDGNETSFLESRIQPDSFFGVSGGQRVDTREAGGGSSMGYSLSQLDAIGDVDPVAEADVYLAYGRDLQAEEILKEAMRANPDRLAVRSKLLEVYAKRRDTKGYELLAAQLFSLTKGDGTDWAKAQEMGRSIDPENPLYQPGGQPPEVFREGGRVVVEPLGASTMPYSVQASPSTLQPPVDEGSPSTMGALDLDLDLDAFEPEPPRPSEKTQPLPPKAAAEGGLDFDLDGGAMVTPAPAPAPATDFGGLSLDLDMPQDPDRTVIIKPAASPAPSADLSLDFGTMKMPAPEAPELPDIGLDDGDVDPLTRKLELAEEFRQIGDLEGARDLLEEVVARASGGLKSKAQGMLDGLA